MELFLCAVFLTLLSTSAAEDNEKSEAKPRRSIPETFYRYYNQQNPVTVNSAENRYYPNNYVLVSSYGHGVIQGGYRDAAKYANSHGTIGTTNSFQKPIYFNVPQSSYTTAKQPLQVGLFQLVPQVGDVSELQYGPVYSGNSGARFGQVIRVVPAGSGFGYASGFEPGISSGISYGSQTGSQIVSGIGFKNQFGNGLQYRLVSDGNSGAGFGQIVPVIPANSGTNFGSGINSGSHTISEIGSGSGYGSGSGSTSTSTYNGLVNTYIPSDVSSTSEHKTYNTKWKHL